MSEETTPVKIPNIDGTTYKVLDTRKEDLDDKVFSWEETANLITARLDEFNRVVANIPLVVAQEVKRIKQADKEELYRKGKYALNVLITSGAINGFLNFARWIL